MGTKLASMKIILLVPTLGIGGTERQVLILCGKLRESGQNFELLALESGKMYLNFLNVGITPRVFLKEKAGVLRKFLAITRLVLYLLRTKNVVLETYLPQSAILGLFVKILRPSNFFLVVNRRSQIIYRRRKFLLGFLDRVASKKADQLTVNSKGIIKEYSSKDGVPIEDILYLPNFLNDTRLTDNTSNSEENTKTRIYCVANHSPIKGVGYLLDAFMKIDQSQYPSKLVLIGTGEETAKLRQIAKVHKSNTIHFFENLTTNQISFTPDSIFVLPSLSEGTSNALMEAMHNGLACVATSVGGTPDLMGDCGILVPPANSNDLKVALEYLLMNTEKRREIGARAHKRIIESQEREDPLGVRLELYRKARLAFVN
jgi:L-malate glycosyltransferase